MCNIPLLDIPLQILEKYKDHLYCQKKGILLPVLANQKMNKIADLYGIKKRLSTHMRRHTFSTVVALANNVSLENKVFGGIWRKLEAALLLRNKKEKRLIIRFCYLRQLTIRTPIKEQLKVVLTGRTYSNRQNRDLITYSAENGNFPNPLKITTR